MKPIFNLSFVQNFVKNKGSCLSKEYINSNTKMRWRCHCGYEWEATFKRIKAGFWCKACSDNRKRTSLDHIKSFVKEKHNGECLSEDYKNNIIKLKWKCERNHIWESTWHSIRSGNWCHFCSGQNKVTKEEILNIIKDKGIILKGECNNVNEKIVLKCNCGYIWETSIRAIKTKHWCPKCAKKTGPTIEEINEKIKDKGICLKKRKSSQTSTFKCNLCGNIFEQHYSLILNGSWCQNCSSKASKIDIDVVNSFVNKKEGALLTKKYKNSSSKLQIKCKNNHIFTTNWNNLKDGCWCKYCSEYKGESIARKVLEIIFNEKLEKYKPEWLINPKTNQKLELDGYSEKLKIAFEYQGQQHYRIVQSFKMNHKTLSQQQYRDDIKRIKCLEHDITLLEIKYFSRIKPTHIFNNIEKALLDKDVFIHESIIKKAIEQII